MRKKIIVFMLLLLYNFMFSEDLIMGTVLSIIQICVVIYYLLLKRDIYKSYMFHLIFVLSSNEYNIIVGSGNKIINYKSIKLPGIPLSISTIILIIMVLLLILKQLGQNKLILLKSYILLGTLYTLTIASLIGILGILISDYNAKLYIVHMLEYIVYISTAILVINLSQNWSYRMEFMKLILIILSGSVLASYCAGMLGVISSYGGVTKFPGNEILMFSPFLINFSQEKRFSEDKRLLMFIGILGIINILLFNATGKGIIFVVIAIVLLTVQISVSRKKLIKIALITIVIFPISFVQLNNQLQSNLLLKIKMDQAIKLIDFKNWGSGLENIPGSPRIRLQQTILIGNELISEPIYMLVGKGFGGYFEDRLGYFVDYDLRQGAFSDDEVELQQYSNPHTSINQILLKIGLIGLIGWSMLVIYYLAMVRKDVFGLISFIWIFFFIGGPSIIGQMGIICCSVAELNFRENKNVFLGVVNE